MRRARKPSIGELNFTQTKKKKITDITQLIVPATKKDLPVAKPKVDEIETWLKTNANILVLTGPSGCCKKTTLELLCNLHNIEMIKWRNPIDNNDEDIYHLVDGMNQKQTFQNFLKRSFRYSSLISNRKITIVEELPNCFTLKPKELASVLLSVVAERRYPLVFIVTEAASDAACHDLFPNQLIDKLKIKQIHLNPITNKNMSKALQRLIHIFNSSLNLNINLKPDELDSISQVSNGDLRYATTLLQYTGFNDFTTEKKEEEINIKKPKKKEKNVTSTTTTTALSKNTEKLKSSKFSSNFNKNVPIGLFHGIGKILHPKRAEEVSEVKLGNSQGALVSDPEHLVDEFSSMALGFISILQENYIKVFSDIDCLANAAEYISYYDTFTDQWKDNNLREESFSMAIRGVLHYNINAQRKFIPVKSSQMKGINFDKNKNLNIIRTTFTDYNCPLNTFHCELIPYLSKLKHGIQNYSQAEYVSKYGSFENQNNLDLKSLNFDKAIAEEDSEKIHISDFSDDD